MYSIYFTNLHAVIACITTFYLYQTKWYWFYEKLLSSGCLCEFIFLWMNEIELEQRIVLLTKYYYVL